MGERATQIEPLTEEEVASLRRALAAGEGALDASSEAELDAAQDGSSGAADAPPALRDFVESVLAARVRDLRETNESLARELQARAVVDQALRESEARLHDLALVIGDWIWEMDASGHYIACSDAVKDVMGYAPEEIIGRTPFDFMVEEDAVALRPFFERMVALRSGWSEVKNRNHHNDGHEVVLLTSSVPVLNDAGELLGFRGVDQDITSREEMEESLRRRTAELRALLEAGSAITATIDYDDVLCRVARAAGEALDAAECVIWEYRAADDLGVFRCLWEREPAPGVAARLVGSTYPISEHPGGADALRTGTIVQQSRSDPDLSPKDAKDMDDWGEKTWLTIPLVFDRRLLGVMALIESDRERDFDADEIRMAEAIGEQAAVALNNALRHRREEERNRWLQALVGVARAIPAASDPDASLVEVARQATRALQSQAAFVYEYAPDRDALVTRARAATRPIGRDHAVGQELAIEDYLEDRRVLDNDELIVQTVSDPELNPQVRERMESLCEKTLLNVPLRWKGQALGLLVVIEDEDERVFTADELDFMSAFGEQVTLAFTAARSATMDGLTDLANHRFFYERLGNELARAKRYGTPVSLLMIDIDDFKQLNDTYGHPVGDQALRQIGRLLAGSLRHGVDTPARYGGEEFAAILPNTRAGAQGEDEAVRRVRGAPVSGHHEGAVALAERLRKSIATSGFPVVGIAPAVELTVSIGVATFPDMAGSMQELVARADAALYAAKRAGKNGVQVYGRKEPAAPSASR